MKRAQLKGSKIEKKQIQHIFTRIAWRYDLSNLLLSFGVDRFWRHMAIKKMPLKGPYLDICAGTLKLSLLLLKQKDPQGHVTALDFCPAMLLEGQKRLVMEAQQLSGAKGRIHLLVGDAERLPLKANSYQGAMIGFGLRNLTDRKAGLREIFRVLKPGGTIIILEFSTPPHTLFRTVYHLYFCYFLPLMGDLIAQTSGAYHHLKSSVLAFPNQEALAGMLRDTGFIEVGYQNLTCGIAALHWGKKPQGATVPKS